MPVLLALVATFKIMSVIYNLTWFTQEICHWRKQK